MKARELRSNERDCILWVIGQVEDSTLQREVLVSQAAVSYVAGGLSTFLELEQRIVVQKTQYEGNMIPGQVFVVEPKSNVLLGEIILWLDERRLSALEYAWYTDEAPSTFPRTTDLRAEVR